MTRRIYLLGVILLGLILAFSAWHYARITAKTVTVEHATISQYLISRATIEPSSGIAEVRTRIDGTVLTVHVREGDRVSAGQLLAEIESDVWQDKLTRIQAEHLSLREQAIGIAKGARTKEKEAIAAKLRASQHELELATKAAQRQKQLFESGSSSSAELERTERNVAIQQARVDFERARLQLARSGGNPHEARAAEAKAVAAKSAIALAEKQLSWTRIVSPIDGVILARRVDPGDTVNVIAGVRSPALFDVADVSKTEVRVEVEEEDAFKINLGQQVEVMFPGGTTPYGKGTINRKGARVIRRKIGGDPANIRADSLVLPVFVELNQNDADQLPIGQRLEARIVVGGHREGNRLPREAIAIRDGAAWVDIRDGFLRKEKKIELLLADSTHVEVKGLKPGTRVFLQD